MPANLSKSQTQGRSLPTIIGEAVGGGDGTGRGDRGSLLRSGVFSQHGLRLCRHL